MEIPRIYTKDKSAKEHRGRSTSQLVGVGEGIAEQGTMEFLTTKSSRGKERELDSRHNNSVKVGRHKGA